MLDIPKLNPPAYRIPRPGMVTAVSSGTAAVVPIEWLENQRRWHPARLPRFIAGCYFSACEEEVAADMVSCGKNVTALDNTVFISVGFARCAPPHRGSD